MDRFVLCITGASGAVYGYRVLQVLSEFSYVDVVVSGAGSIVLREELDKDLQGLKEEFPSVKFHGEKDLTAPIASGSVLTGYRGVVVIPCSMSTLASVANGVNNNLIHRVCEVALKERVKLVMVVREMPYSRVHIENMLKVTDAGAIVTPASPGFYHRPGSLQEVVDFVVGKVLDQLGVKHELYKRWKGGGK
ncbi:UbiX family flavin prenyltransferase [Hydrogenivirga sp. 128-5-R1-1]|uniref:UbiX family flavin prenyltransferase n=1 Tax=Hydrogenivirga sp. 128-5-R1-1 TaxID=392423 RepID=UPI00015F0CCC|nr:UbiX family flavin prenyltransferase [Hydrogenivirga sp. 128-5-R1-1]EDP75776.1 phenylacrylic acid decarboxylase [Hydrogenivirga sp. 128-5-R1-1]